MQNTTIQNSGIQVVNELETVFDNVNAFLEGIHQELLNKIPFEQSWTIAQVCDHITRSTGSITHALQMDARPAIRDIIQRQQELKDMFLDMKRKFKSPEFILPTQQQYDKDALLQKYSNTCHHLINTIANIDVSGVIQHPAFGDITKLELLYFVLYHTQRHLQQMKNIKQAIVT